MPGSPNLVVQTYENVGTGVATSTHRVCSCEFEYHYRWPQFYDAVLAGAPVAVEILEERDRFLEQHIHERCDAGDFEYPSRWEQFYDAFRDPARLDEVVALLEERDRALEAHIAAMKCFGVDYAHGVTCEFDYPSRWRELAAPLLSDDNERVRAAVGLLQARDIDLETHLTTRMCGDIDVHGLLPDSITQVYLNVT